MTQVRGSRNERADVHGDEVTEAAGAWNAPADLKSSARPPRNMRLSHEAELVAHAVPSCTRRVMITRLRR